MAKKQFKAESKRLLDLMINSIYTHKEIFLREIISNASDALDKLCYKSLTDDKVGMNREDFKIEISVDKDARTITVSDNGIGMTGEELESNLGVIAKSGSFQFKNDEDVKKSTDTDIIGQFGVGFYSAFMVAEKVTVISRAYGSDEGYKWESSGADGYTVTPCEMDSVGTDVIMKVKEDTEEEKYSEFLESFRIQGLIKKYSDYIRWPIIMEVEDSRPVETTDEKGEKKTEWETYSEKRTINSMIPIWQRAKKDVSDEDCAKYYKEHFYDSEDPAKVIRVSAEGTVSYKAMLFVPSKVPFDYYTREYQPGLALYTSGVMIMEKCQDLIPEYFRFVKGVVDSPDLSLNISREILQHDRQLRVIASSLEKRIHNELKKLMEDDREKYEKFFTNFGLQLKYGVLSDYGSHKDSISDLLMFITSKRSGMRTLKEYTDDCPEEQKYIYYACGDSASMIDALPQTEIIKDKGYEILYLTENVDEFVIQMLGKFADKEFKSVNDDDLGFETEDDKKANEDKAAENSELLEFVKDALGGAIAEARISGKLKSHPVCLTTKGAISLEMEKYFSTLPGENGEKIKAERVLELNGDHPNFEALKKAYSEDREKAKKYAEILYDESLLIAGMPIENPARFAELVSELMK